MSEKHFKPIKDQLRRRYTKLAWRTVRWIAGLLFISMFIHYYSRGTMVEAMVSIFFGVMGAIFLVPEIVDCLVERTFNLKYRTRIEQNPNFSRFELAKRRGEMEKAEEILLDLTKEFPKSIKPYQELIVLMVTELDDMERAEKYFLKAMRQFENEEERHLIQRTLRNCQAIKGELTRFEKNERISTDRLKEVKRYTQRPPGV